MDKEEIRQRVSKRHFEDSDVTNFLVVTIITPKKYMRSFKFQKMGETLYNPVADDEENVISIPISSQMTKKDIADAILERI